MNRSLELSLEKLLDEELVGFLRCREILTELGIVITINMVEIRTIPELLIKEEVFSLNIVVGDYNQKN